VILLAVVQYSKYAKSNSTVIVVVGHVLVVLLFTIYYKYHSTNIISDPCKASHFVLIFSTNETAGITRVRDYIGTMVFIIDSKQQYY